VLSQDGERYAVDDRLAESLAADVERFPTVVEEARERYPDEPYRQKLRLMRERLDRVDDVRPGEYPDGDAFLADLDVIADSLATDGQDAVRESFVEPLRRQVDTFGLTLASLDLRDHREKHTETVAETVAVEGVDYREMDEDARQEFLTEAILQDDPVVDADEPGDVSETTERVLRRFQGVRRVAGRVRPAGDRHLLHLDDGRAEPRARSALLGRSGRRRLVAGPLRARRRPLLETESALNGAERILGELFDNEAYATALEVRGRDSGGDARLFRLQQGERVPRRELGPLREPASDRAVLPRGGCHPPAVPRARRLHLAGRRPDERGPCLRSPTRPSRGR